MAVTRSGKKFLKITSICIGILIVLLVGFHFWFQAHAKGLIEDLVASKSNNKLKLKIEKLRFNYLSSKIEIEKAVFTSTDTANSETAYRFAVDKIKLETKSIYPIIFRKQILIDSLTLQNPLIEVTRLRSKVKKEEKIERDISIPEEMGKIYTSIQDALEMLEIKRFQLNNGTFSLINKISPDQTPVRITNLNFFIDNLQVNDELPEKNQKILFSDNVVLLSTNQDILFPDGRHRLSFSKFSINLQNKLVQFDSCTIAAVRTDSNNASFNVFFDALKLTNIDFDTLYKSEVIKADSVYCINPRFNLEVEAGKRTSTKSPPKLENIIKQLTGDLQLAHVIVSNADFNIKTIKNDVPSSFTFSKNSFEMQGLSIDQDAEKPIKVKSFVMAIRNYDNFIKDSAYNIKFDSILFKDDRITLSNFLFTKLAGAKILNTFSIPQFNLQGLSWDDLVFDNRLKADQATMFYPVIDYTVSNKKGKQSIFESLGAVNEFMDLQYLEVVDGTIDLKLKKDLRIQLQNANVSVQSNSLLTSTRIAGIKSSLSQLSFKKGSVHAGNLDINLNDIRYTGKGGRFGAGNISVSDKSKKLLVLLEDVAVEKMQIDEVAGNIFADGVKWQKGNVTIKAFPGENMEENNSSFLELKNVQGSNTMINATTAGKTISSAISTVSFNELIKKPGSKLLLNGLAIKGSDLVVKDENLNASINNYNIVDNQNSLFNQVVFSNNSSKTDVNIQAPIINLTPHIQKILDGNLAIDAITITRPVIDIVQSSRETRQQTSLFPKVDISEIKLINPEIKYSQQSDSGIFRFAWAGTKNPTDFLLLSGLQTTGQSLSLNNLAVNVTEATYISPKGNLFNSGNGKLLANLRNISLQNNETAQPVWSATVSNIDVRDFQLDSIGNNKIGIALQTARIKEFTLTSSSINNIRKLMSGNRSFSLENFTGNYTGGNNNFSWYNAGFNRNGNIFSLDSFSLMPTIAKDSFIARQDFQKDYITLKSGAIKAGPLDIDNYIQNNILNSKHITINKFVFTDYKDKQLPFNAGIIKPLPTGLLKQLPLQMAVDSITFNNAEVEYTEVSEKTKLPGTIPVKRLSVVLVNVKNYDFSATDSLTIKATGYVMDSIWTKLQVKESYTDSLGGFLMTLRMKPGDITVLNPAIIPLASVKVLSGQFDTLNMRAIGREYLALGEMNMFYEDLKIQLLKKGEEGRKTLLTRLANFAANTFVIRKNNKKRTGNVFFIRDRDRSAINYLIKIAMSGMSSSAGVKSNKKMIRQYKKELEKRGLPPIELD